MQKWIWEIKTLNAFSVFYSTHFVCLSLCFFKMDQPPPLLLFIFSLSKQTSLQFLQQIHVKKCPSSVQCWVSNPQPLDHESSPMTTTPGLSVFRYVKTDWFYFSWLSVPDTYVVRRLFFLSIISIFQLIRTYKTTLGPI